jgi:hypothetical protein
MNTTTAPLFPTREEWLLAAIDEVRPLFDAVGHKLTDRIRVTCGFPSTASRSGAVGQCFASAASADQHYEVMVSPVLDDPREVMQVLIHELVHTLPGCMNHGTTFQAAASAVFLAPGTSRGWKATVHAPGFDAAYHSIIDGLGTYPHAHLKMGQAKKQTTRLLKAMCPHCGYTIRLTKMWADKGLPVCSLDGRLMALA